MIDFSPTESDKLLKSAARDFMRSKCSKEVLLKLHETEEGYTPEIWQGVVENQWLGIILPERYGGSENKLTSAGVLFEELGRGPLPGPYFSSGILSALVVMEAGNEEQRRELLSGIAEGKHVLTLALTEAEYGWDPASIQVRAARDGDGFTLNGTKLFVQDAFPSTHLIVVARTNKAEDPSLGLTLFLLERNLPGISVRSLSGFMGWQCEVKIEGVKVPHSAVLGELDKGWRPLELALERAAPVLCAYMVGGCEAVLEMSLERSRTRVQFDVPIGRFQRVQDHIVDIVNHLDAARWTTYEALWKLDSGRPAAESVHLAKAVSSEAYREACTSAHHVHGGVGYTWEHGLAMHTRMSRSLYHHLGSPSHHKKKLAEALGLTS